MARKPAMRTKMELSLEIDPSDMGQILDHAKKLKALKEEAESLGFAFTADVDTRLGSAEVKADPK